MADTNPALAGYFKSVAVFTPEELTAFEQQIRADEREKTRDLRLESFPLHTEKPEWAKDAPKQVDAACKRGADVIAFTELHGTLADQVKAQVATYGYDFFNYDSGSTALAFKTALNGKASTVSDRTAKVVFNFHGHKVTVFSVHIPKNIAANQDRRKAIANQLVKSLQDASSGHDLAFFMGDTNPAGALSDPKSEPRATLNKAGIVLVYEELNSFPANIGVNMIGRPKADTLVTAHSVAVYPNLGSDHYPVVASYGVPVVND